MDANAKLTQGTILYVSLSGIMGVRQFAPGHYPSIGDNVDDVIRTEFFYLLANW